MNSPFLRGLLYVGFFSMPPFGGGFRFTLVRPSQNVVSHVHVVPKEFKLEVGNFTGMLVSICSCAPGVSLVDSFYIGGNNALDLFKICKLCRIYLQKCLTYSHETSRNVGQHM